MENTQEQEKYLKHRSKERILTKMKSDADFLKTSETNIDNHGIVNKIDAIMSLSDANLEQEAKTETVVDILKNELQTDIKEVEAEIGGDALRKLSQEAKNRLDFFLRKKYRPILNCIKQLNEGTTLLIKEIYKKGKSEDITVWAEVDIYEKKIKQAIDFLEKETQKSPEAFLASGLLKIRKNKRNFEKFGIIETPEVEKIYHQIKTDARKKLEGRNGVVTLVGGTGTGKTVLAKRLAEESSANGEPIIVSAHSKMTPDDLIDRLGIVPVAIDPEEIPEQIEKAIKNYKKDHQDITEEELAEAKNIIKQTIQGQSEQKTMATKKVLEAVGKAAELGVKVVIDEFNYLSSQTLGSLNDLLNKTNAKEGFGIILTGNLGPEFLERQELDISFINRILENTIEYKNPPQEFEKTLQESILTREDYLKGEKTIPRDLYVSAITQLADKKGNLIAPENALQKMWDLSTAFSLIQKVSQGENLRDVISGGSGFQQLGENHFKKIFLSYRNFNSVIRSWKLDNYNKSLDYYLLNNIIRPAAILEPQDAAQLFYIFQKKGFMCGEKFDDITVNTEQWKISSVPVIVDGDQFLISNEIKKMKAFTPQELVEAGYGIKMPSFAEIELSNEELNSIGIKETQEEILIKTESFLKQENIFEQEEINKLEIICGGLEKV